MININIRHGLTRINTDINNSVQPLANCINPCQRKQCESVSKKTVSKNNLRTQFALKAITWLNVPYQHRGITRNGCDCTGLIIGAAQEVGLLKDYKLRKYPIDWNIHQVDNHIEQQLKIYGFEVPNNKIENGDIVLMHFGRNISHCGIMVNVKKMMMIHCYRTVKKVTFGILRNSKWSARWQKTYRLNEK